MKVVEDAVYFIVTFQRDDWNDNTVKEVIELIKSYDKEKWVYMGITKKWKVSKNTTFKEDLNKLINIRNENRVDPDQYDITEFLEQFNY